MFGLGAGRAASLLIIETSPTNTSASLILAKIVCAISGDPGVPTFDHSVLVNEVTANELCIYHAPKARCMMIEERKVRKTYPQEWREYNQAQINEKSRSQELLFELCNGIDEPSYHS